jgi:hypothetical protein
VKQTFATDPKRSIASYWLDLPLTLFDHLEGVVGPLTPSHQQVALVLESVRIEDHVHESPADLGRPPCLRKPMARAFLAKAVLNIPTTKDLIERLVVDIRLRRICGFTHRVPSGSSFSRAFSDFALSGLTDTAHAAAVRDLFGETVFHHGAIDAASIPAREHGVKKLKPAPTQRKKPGRQKGQGFRESRREPGPQERQLTQSLEQMLGELPRVCDHGVKIGPQGYTIHWRGYKAHAHVGDGGIPLAFVTSSASVNDSLAAIPLLRLTSGRILALFYVLMDKAYTGDPIAQAAKGLGHVAIVPPKAVRGGLPAPEFTPDRQRRYDNRTIVERFFSDLKDNHGGNHLLVKGGAKVQSHLMFGVLAILGLSVFRL